MFGVNSTWFKLDLMESRWLERNKPFGGLMLTERGHHRNNGIGVYFCMQMELGPDNVLIPTLLMDSISVFSMETRFCGAGCSLMDSAMEYALASETIKQIKIANVFVDDTLYRMLSRRSAWVEHNIHEDNLVSNFLLDCK